MDIQSSKFDLKKYKTFLPKKEKINKLNLKLIKKYLKKSSRPIILLGNGINVAQQSSNILQIIKKLKIPTLTTQLGKEAIEYENQFFIGHTSKGDRAGNLAIQNSDFILILGSSLHSQTIGWSIINFLLIHLKFKSTLTNQF